MTLQEILESDKLMLTASDISEILGSDPDTIRVMVRQDAEALAPLQPIRIGNRAKFPRMRFINWITGGNVNGLRNGKTVV